MPFLFRVYALHTILINVCDTDEGLYASGFKSHTSSVNTSVSTQWTYTASLDTSSPKSLKMSASKSAHHPPSQKTSKTSANNPLMKECSLGKEAASQRKDYHCFLSMVNHSSSFCVPRLTIVGKCSVSPPYFQPNFQDTLQLFIILSIIITFPHQKQLCVKETHQGYGMR